MGKISPLVPRPLAMGFHKLCGFQKISHFSIVLMQLYLSVKWFTKEEAKKVKKMAIIPNF